MQIIQQTFSNKADELAFFKDENKKLRIKLAQYQKKLILYDKQQSKLKDLEKVNFENSSRLLQCISNVRDLLHSNKQLRQELDKQKKQKQNLEIKVKQSQKESSCEKINSLSPLQKITEANEQQQPITYSPFQKAYKLRKIQKLSGLKINSQRYTKDQIQHLKTEPVQDALKKMNQSNEIMLNSFGSNPQSYKKKKNKFNKFMEAKQQEQNYKKAKLRRKLSLRKSEDRMEVLQYKPSCSSNQNT